MKNKFLFFFFFLFISSNCYGIKDFKVKSYLLYDFNTNQVLLEKNKEAKVYPASLTKAMTAYVALKQIEKNNLNLKEKTTISNKAWKTGGSRSFMEVGKKVSVLNLMKGMLIQSGNDAAVALSEHIAGSEEEFAVLMNKYAQELGMKNTNFTNVTGLHNKNHYTTSQDFILVAKSIIEEFPEYYYFFSQPTFTFNNITQQNRNKLLFREDNVDGLKTGWTSNSGYSYLTSGVYNNKRYIAVIFGAETSELRFDYALQLFKYANVFFKQMSLTNINKKFTEIPVYYGNTSFVSVYPKENFNYSLPIEHKNDFHAKITIKSKLKAPVNKNIKVGKIEFFIKNKKIKEVSLVTGEQVNKGSLLKRLQDFWYY